MRLLGGTAVVLTVVVVGAAFTAYAKYRSVWGSIRRVTISQADLGKRPPKQAGAMNILVIGSDSRSGRDRQFGRSVQGQRSDTIMLVHLPPGRLGAVVVSIPRDTAVPVLNCPAAPSGPGQHSTTGQHSTGQHSTGQRRLPGQAEQVNSSFAQGGPACLWKTVEHVTGVHLDHFVELNFTGFERVVNDIGGVNICLPYPVNDPLSRLHMSRGRHHVGGAQALAFWRARYIGQGSDLQRIQRDQYLMASLLQGIEHSDLLGSPARIYSVVTDVAAAMTTDIRDQATLLTIAGSVRAVSAGSVQFIEMPTTPYRANPNWVQLRQPQARTLFAGLERDRVQPTSRPSASPAASPAGPSRSPGAERLARRYGGITGSANVCRNSRAFSGPDGGR
jgi:LCP family protein required for cell wall assembly